MWFLHSLEQISESVSYTLAIIYLKVHLLVCPGISSEIQGVELLLTDVYLACSVMSSSQGIIRWLLVK